MAESIAYKAPSFLWTLLEGRWVFETGSFYSMRWLLKRLPRGDGHPVIVFPGFMASSFSTSPLRRLLKDLGYEVHDWGLGRNLKFSPEVEERMSQKIKKVHADSGRKVSLVGWSLGGVFAREMAKTHGDIIRNVISLGSPITGPRHASRVNPLFEFLNGKPSEETQKRLDVLHYPPDVPCTSIYSKTDGIVHWHGSIQPEQPLAENIEVPASHCGMGTNPLIMYLLADRLSQPEDLWAPFDKTGIRKFLFKSSKVRAT